MQSQQNQPLDTISLSPADLDKLRAAIASQGERGFLASSGLSRYAASRILSGLPVRRGTVALAKLALQHLAAAQ